MPKYRTLQEKLELIKKIGGIKENKTKKIRELYGIHYSYYYQLRMHFEPFLKKAGYESWQDFEKDENAIAKLISVIEGGSDSEKEEDKTEKRDENKETEKTTQKEEKRKDDLLKELDEDLKKKEVDYQDSQDIEDTQDMITEKALTKEEALTEEETTKTPFYKKKWFWIMLIVTTGVILASFMFKKRLPINTSQDDKKENNLDNFKLPPEF